MLCKAQRGHLNDCVSQCPHINTFIAPHVPTTLTIRLGTANKEMPTQDEEPQKMNSAILNELLSGLRSARVFTCPKHSALTWKYDSPVGLRFRSLDIWTKERLSLLELPPDFEATHQDIGNRCHPPCAYWRDYLYPSLLGLTYNGHNHIG